MTDPAPPPGGRRRLWWRGWRVPLRIARRDALRARGRSILVLVMIALPVLAVTMADVVMHTMDVRGTESLDRRLGAATALVTAQADVGEYVQGPDPDEASFSLGGEGGSPLLTAAQVSESLGGARLVERRSGDLRVVSDDGVASAEATEVDLGAPAVAGLFDLTSGRLPRAPDEVVVNQAMVEQGYSVGDHLELPGDVAHAPRVVGIAESTTVRDFPIAVGPLGSLGVEVEGTRSWLVDGSRVTWDDVRRLNAGGATVLSRAVMLDPPARSQMPEQVRSTTGGGMGQAIVAVAVLVVVMALLEVVLLAGPAFAVGARRQARSLALLAAVGGTPQQARRVVLAGAVVLGVTAAVLGAVLGIGLAFAAMPLVQQFSSTWLGPFQVPWLQLTGVAAFGVVSALLAAVVPAHIASRQDVVAVLAGRRGDRAPSLRSPLFGLVLMGLGVVGAVVGATRPGGETLIAGAAILSVLGMILLVPALLAGLSRLSGRLPLTMRYAVRDAARHRTRTVPAVAAVAATVAGVVALGIGNTSDAAENEATYVPSTTQGVGTMISYAPRPDWPAFRALLKREVPDADVTALQGVPASTEDGGSVVIQLQLPGSDLPAISNYGSALGSDVLVSGEELTPAMVGLSAPEGARASAALRAGGLVVFTDQRPPADGTPVHVLAQTYGTVGDGSEPTEKTLDLPATFVRVRPSAGPQAVASPTAARALGVPVSEVALLLTGTRVTPAQEEAVTEGVTAISADASFGVERGYQAEDSTRIALLILAALGAVLMLGGTLTATFLALSDARPDLATLSAVGASPRTRRGVAAAYALVVGMVGAAMGAVVGFIPGIAISYPLTRVTGAVVNGSGYSSGRTTGPFLDIPWMLVVGLVVLLPLATAVIVGLAARSRLPLVARLD
ncbi:MAG: transporter permease [Marmoricola sp.]|nr:transporter permease [Marmoricola sp.]